MLRAKLAIVCGRSNDITKFPTYFAFALFKVSGSTGSVRIRSISFINSTTALSATALRTLALALNRDTP